MNLSIRSDKSRIVFCNFCSKDRNNSSFLLSLLFIIRLYTNDELQRIIRTSLNLYYSTAKVVKLSKKQERLIKTRTSNLYCGKSYMDCYNFIQHCENHFITA